MGSLLAGAGGPRRVEQKRRRKVRDKYFSSTQHQSCFKIHSHVDAVVGDYCSDWTQILDR